MVGRPAHRGHRVAYSKACLGLTLVNVILGPLLPEFHDFRDRIRFCCHGVLPTLVSYLPLCTTCGDKTYIQKK